MRKCFTLTVLITMVVFLYNCNPARKATTNKAVPVIPKINYESQLKEVIAANCAPCHFPAKGGNKKPFDNFASVSANINEMIARISLKPEERGFMPFKRTKLSDSTIAIFKQWQSDGMIEK